MSADWHVAHCVERGLYYGSLNLLFAGEAGARRHLENRLAGVAELKEAPQLFIGV